MTTDAPVVFSNEPEPFPWLSCAVVVATVVTYPVLIVGLCVGWW